MLGTPDDADDIVQDAWLRYQDRADTIDNPAAWLTTVVTRLSIDRLRSVKRRREDYVGPWLPEPIFDLAGIDPGPDDALVMAESLTLGFLALMERLSPLERAVHLLHKVFALPLDEIAAIIERSPAATRQLSKRANDHVMNERVRYEPDAADVAELSAQMLQATLSGDLEALQAFLAADIVHLSDGGADHRAARRPVVGPDRVAMLYVGLAKRIEPDMEFHEVEANGQPALYITQRGAPFLLQVTDWVDGKVAAVWGVVNPDKLARFHREWLESAHS